MTDKPDPTVQAAQTVADTLHERGHSGQAARIYAVLGEVHVGAILLEALRETLQVVLTAIEAVDPVSATMVDELRVEVDARLSNKPSRALQL